MGKVFPKADSKAARALENGHTSVMISTGKSDRYELLEQEQRKKSEDNKLKSVIHLEPFLEDAIQKAEELKINGIIELENEILERRYLEGEAREAAIKQQVYERCVTIDLHPMEEVIVKTKTRIRMDDELLMLYSYSKKMGTKEILNLMIIKNSDEQIDGLNKNFDQITLWNELCDTIKKINYITILSNCSTKGSLQISLFYAQTALENKRNQIGKRIYELNSEKRNELFSLGVPEEFLRNASSSSRSCDFPAFNSQAVLSIQSLNTNFSGGALSQMMNYGSTQFKPVQSNNKSVKDEPVQKSGMTFHC